MDAASPRVDYTTWSTADLIERVTELEARLHARRSDRNSPSSPTPGKKKAKKPAKQFDPDKYHTRLIALKLAYLGANYNGFEHHSNNTTPLPTVEEELWKALRKTRLIFPRRKDGHGEEEVCWEGCEYSKCGRTDRGVSAFGQVVGLRVRSARPKTVRPTTVGDDGWAEEGGQDCRMPDVPPDGEGRDAHPAFDHVRDELPYIQVLNRVLPPDIRILAWCPTPPENFSARFHCKERRYRYFFTNPAYAPLPASHACGTGEAWLDVAAMNEAAKKYKGLHDFRNLCKVDPSKQLSNFQRRIFYAGIHEVRSAERSSKDVLPSSPKLYYFEVRGSAFLWHQVRHLVAILFLVGQGYEKPSIVDDLLDVHKTPARPMYEMASDAPLVLWDCIFPDLDKLPENDRANSAAASGGGYNDDLGWVYIGEEIGGRDHARRTRTAVEDGKYGRNGIMDDLWAIWRKSKMDEVLAWSLMEVVSSQEPVSTSPQQSESDGIDEISARVFDGSEIPRSVGTYVPVLQREKLETPDVVNARYAARKGLSDIQRSADNADMDE